MIFSDFHHLSVPGDGACFFHSIVAILEVENSKKVKGYQFTSEKESNQMRKKTVSWLRDNLNYKVKGTGMSITAEINDTVNDELRLAQVNGIDPKYTDISEYLTFISDNSSYAGQIEIYAVSELLKRNIRVFTSNKKTADTPLKNLGLGYEINNDSEKDIFLYHNFGKGGSRGVHHFDAMLPKKIDKSKEKIPKKAPKKTQRVAKISNRVAKSQREAQPSPRVDRRSKRVDRRSKRVDRRSNRRVDRRSNRVDRRVDRRSNRRSKRVDRRSRKLSRKK